MIPPDTLFEPRDPAVAPADRPRLSRQSETILGLLQSGPKTNGQLAGVTARYGARLFDLRKAGFNIKTQPAKDGTGVVVYSLVGT